MLAYLASLLCMASVYSIAALGINLQWGYTGLFNIGIAGWFAAGAYTSAILTTGEASYLGGFGLPFPVGLIGAAIVAGIFGWLIGLPTLKLEFGFFAIATIGLGRSMVLLFKNEQWLTGGVWGIGGIPKPLSNVFPANANWAYGFLALAIMLILYFLLEKVTSSPWGRLQLAIKDDEDLTEMLGKDVWHYRMQSLVLGSMLVGVAGATFAHYQRYINPASFGDIMATFIIWVMVVTGGTGNNKGSIAGAFSIWLVWTLSEFGAGYLPIASTKVPYVRTLIVGLIIVALLRWRPRGLIGRKKAVSASAEGITETTE